MLRSIHAVCIYTNDSPDDAGRCVVANLTGLTVGNALCADKISRSIRNVYAVPLHRVDIAELCTLDCGDGVRCL